jgi:TRAP-type C4-dicarboxylate transport system permease small subunit
MTKQTGTIITIVLAALTLLCCTAPLCSAGVALFAGAGENLDPTWDIPQGVGTAPCCLSILVLVVPLLSWLFLVRGKEDGTVEEEYIEGSIEEDFTA